MLGHWSGGALICLVSQAVAITFEDAVTAIASKFGFAQPTPMKKLFGYIWVAAWFTYSLPIWSGPHLTAGFIEDDIQFSPIMGLSRGEWFPKPDPVHVLSTGKVHVLDLETVIEFLQCSFVEDYLCHISQFCQRLALTYTYGVSTWLE